jgi:hypothetical protein
MGIGGDAVLGRREVGCLVARELHRAAGEIDELVAIHGTPFLLFITIAHRRRALSRPATINC